MSKKGREVPTPNVIKYNWEILKKHTNSNPHKMLEFFTNAYVTKAENYFYLNPWAARIVVESRNKSQSYIQNVPRLLEYVNTATDSELFVYLDLCSQRSYFDFINTKGKLNYLPNWKISDYEVEALHMNRLLTFDDKNIYLLYELGE